MTPQQAPSGSRHDRVTSAQGTQASATRNAPFGIWAQAVRTEPNHAGAWLLSLTRVVVEALVPQTDAEREDIASEAVLRIWARAHEHPSCWPRATLFAWACGVVRNIALETTRRMAARGICEICELLEKTAEEPRLDGHEEARWLARRAARLMRRLPPPYAQILQLQRIEGWSRKQIMRWLQHWRPGTPEETARRLIRESHRRFLICWPDGDPHVFWPGSFTRKNHWILTPPPSCRH